MRRKSKKKYYLIILLLVIGLGFAYLSSSLNLHGIFSLGDNRFNLVLSEDVRYMDNIIDTRFVYIEKNNIEVTGEFETPGDTLAFEIDLINKGNVDAMYKSFDISGLSEEQEKYFDISVTYPDGTIPEEYEYIKAGVRQPFLVTINYNFDDIEIDELPKDDLYFIVSMSVECVKANYLAVNSKFHGYILEPSECSSVYLDNFDLCNSGSIFSFGPEYSRNVVFSLNGEGIPSEYEKSKDLSENKNGDIMGYYKDGTTYVVSMGDKLYANPNSTALFFGYDGIENLELLDTSKVRIMDIMFKRAELSNLDFSVWDTSNVTSMVGTFQSAKLMGGVNINGWDTSNVIDMMDMFLGTYLEQDLILTSFNTSNVANMTEMFYGTISAPALYYSDVLDIRERALYSIYFENLSFDSIEDIIFVEDMFGSPYLKEFHMENADFTSILNFVNNVSNTGYGYIDQSIKPSNLIYNGSNLTPKNIYYTFTNGMFHFGQNNNYGIYLTPYYYVGSYSQKVKILSLVDIQNNYVEEENNGPGFGAGIRPSACLEEFIMY